MGQGIACLLQRISQYVLFAGLGVIGGALGTASAIGLSIVVQASLSPVTVSLPGAVPLSLVATLIGLVVSWLMAWSVYRIWPGKNADFKGQTKQALLLVSALTSLLQTIFLTHNL
jgi:uncharacterized membrane protein YccC